MRGCGVRASYTRRADRGPRTDANYCSASYAAQPEPAANGRRAHACIHGSGQ